MDYLKIEVKVDGKVVCGFEATITKPVNAVKKFWSFILRLRDGMYNWIVSNILGDKQ